MRILHVCLGERYIDGYGYQENILTKIHKQMGNEVFILASTQTLLNQKRAFVKPSQYINEHGIPVKRIPYISWMPHKVACKLRLYRGTYESIDDFRPDLIFVHAPCFMDTYKIAKYAKKHNVMLYADSHTDYVNSARDWLSMNILHKVIYRWCYKQLIPYTIKFFGTLPIRSKFMIEVYHVPKEKIELLPMGIDLTNLKDLDRKKVRNEMREQYKYDEADFVVVTGGKLEKRKNTLELINAVLSIDSPKIKLFLFGSVSDDIRIEVEQLIEKNPDKVVYGGWVKPEEIYKYLIIGDLCVFPGTHSAIWEQAVGLGMPCLFKHWDNITHIDLGGNCVLINDMSISGIAEEILSLYNDRERLSKMKKTAESKGSATFSYEEIAKRAIGL